MIDDIRQLFERVKYKEEKKRDDDEVSVHLRRIIIHLTLTSRMRK